MLVNFSDLIPKARSDSSDQIVINPDGLFEIKIDGAPNSPANPLNQDAIKNIDQGISGAILNASKTNSVDSSFLFGTAEIESNFNPNAGTNKSSAKGLFQFTDGTGSTFGLNQSNVFDPQLNANAAAELANQNKSGLRQSLINRGLSEDEANAIVNDRGALYLAHQQGQTGAANLLTGQNVSEQSIRNNYSSKILPEQLDFYLKNPKRFAKDWIDHANSVISKYDAPRSGSQVAESTQTIQDLNFDDLIPEKPNPGSLANQENVSLSGITGNAPKGDLSLLGNVVGGLRQVQQGLTFGFGDEADAGLRSVIDYLSAVGNGEEANFSDIYENNLSLVNQELSSFQQESPNIAIASEAIGAALPAVATAGVSFPIASSQGIGKAILANSTLGAGAGALQGAGDSTPGNRLQNANRGAAIGATVGGAVPVALRGLSGAGGLVNNFRQSITRSPEQIAQQQVSKAFSRDGIGPNTAQNTVNELGNGAVLTDAGGANVKALTDSLSNLPGRSKQSIVNFVENRQQGRNNRVSDDINELLGDAENFQVVADDLIKVKQAVNKPLYDAAFKSDVEVNRELVELLERPSFEKAYKKAVRIAADDGREIEKITYIKGEIQSIPSHINTQTLDYIKRGIDDVIDSNIKNFKPNNIARIAQSAKSKFVNLIDESNPDYKVARSTASDIFSLERSLQDGLKFLSKDSNITSKQLSKLSEDQKDVFRVGAAKAIRDKMLSSADGADAFKRIFGNQLQRERIEAVFPDSASFKEFEKSMRREQIFAETRAAVVGNSKTAERLATESDLNLSTSGLKDKFINQVINKTIKRFKAPREEVAEEISKILLRPEANIQDITDSLNLLLIKKDDKIKPVIERVISILSGQEAGEVSAQ